MSSIKQIYVCVLLYVIIWYWNSPKRSKKNKWDHPIRCVAPGGQIRPRVRPPSKDLGAKWWVKCWNHQLFWDFMKISGILIRNPYIFVHETSWNDPCLGCWADQSSNFHGKLRILRHSQSLRSKLSGVSEVGRILGRIAPGSGGVLSCCVASPGRDPWDMLGPLGSFSAKPRLEVRWLFGAFSRFPWTPKVSKVSTFHTGHMVSAQTLVSSHSELWTPCPWPFYDHSMTPRLPVFSRIPSHKLTIRWFTEKRLLLLLAPQVLAWNFELFLANTAAVVATVSIGSALQHLPTRRQILMAMMIIKTKRKFL